MPPGHASDLGGELDHGGQQGANEPWLRHGIDKLLLEEDEAGRADKDHRAYHWGWEGGCVSEQSFLGRHTSKFLDS